jgi:DNA-binding GntR family transcriptional regulator
LPSYAALARQHHVSVHTVRRAIKELRDAGVLRGQSGVSVTVAREPGPAPVPDQPLAERVGRLEAELGELRDRLDAHLRRHGGDLP